MNWEEEGRVHGGGLSNMSNEFPLMVNGQPVGPTEVHPPIHR
jgi:hypothetical protein